jgi:sulfite exporter TauE/SafE
LYGFGLISSNLIIALATVLISLVPRLIIPGLIFNPYAINILGALVSMCASICLLIFVTTRNYMPHSKQSKDIGTLDWEKNKTPYLFGILAGFAPCIFELIIYSQCLQFSLGYGFIEGILVVLYFSFGTFVGLFPLALAKYGTSHIVKSKENKKNTIFVSMIIIIVVFNITIMILSLLEISVFPLQKI